MLRSANFVYRPLVPADAPGFVAAVRESSATVAPWMPWAHADYSMDEALSWISLCQQGWVERGSFEFGIFNAASGTFAGGCGLNHFNPIHGFCNLGYWVRQSFQGRGAASEAIVALADFAFSELPIGRIEVVVGVGNAGSLRAAQKAGAVQEGIARNRVKLGERFIDAHMLSLVRPALD